jgi:hypothetical protein
MLIKCIDKSCTKIISLQQIELISSVHNLVETAKRQPHQPKTKKDHVTTESLIELCTKYKDSNDLTVVRDLSMITLCFSVFLLTMRLVLFVVKNTGWRVGTTS